MCFIRRGLLRKGQFEWERLYNHLSIWNKRLTYFWTKGYLCTCLFSKLPGLFNYKNLTNIEHLAVLHCSRGWSSIYWVWQTYRYVLMSWHDWFPLAVSRSTPKLPTEVMSAEERPSGYPDGATRPATPALWLFHRLCLLFPRGPAVRTKTTMRQTPRNIPIARSKSVSHQQQ